MKDLTPDHLRCAQVACPSVQLMEDGKTVRVVGTEDYNKVGCDEGENAVLIPLEYFIELPKWLAEQAMRDDRAKRKD